MEDEDNKREDIYQHQGVDQGNAPAQGSSREKYLPITFGSEECTPIALRLYLDHYEIAMEQNIAKRIVGWDNGRLRANEIRLQLKGGVVCPLDRTGMRHAEFDMDHGPGLMRR